MRQLRRVLGPLAGSWLFCQIATLTVPPVTLGLRSASELECTCPQGADSACPMHHQKTPAGARQCLLRSAADGAPSVLTSLLGPLGYLPSVTTPIRPVVGDSALVGEFTMVCDTVLTPDAPPPRF
jgi:hypothetical protein